MEENRTGYEPELAALCDQVRSLCKQGSYEQSRAAIAQAMSRFPHAPQPQNLMGVVLELQGDINTAVLHYRAAWTFDPGYRPGSQNLHRCASLYARDPLAFDETDCPPEEGKPYALRVEYDEKGIGHLVKRRSSR